MAKNSFCLFLLSAAAVLAQPFAWETVEMAPGVYLNDICILAGGSHGWTVGSASAGGELVSAYLRTTDGGVSWLPLIPPGGSIGLNGVFFATPDSGWVVGANGTIFFTSDGGFNWSPQNSGTSRPLNKVHFLDSRRGWVCGTGSGNAYLVLKTTNSGATWLDQSFGNDCYSADDIWFADENHGWVAGWDRVLNPVMQHTTDGGTSWTAQALGLPAGNGGAASVCFPTPTQGWASVSSIYQSPAGSILHTTDGGTTWTIQGRTNEHYNYLDAQDTLRCAVVGYSVLGSQQVKVSVTTDGGNTWSQRFSTLSGYTYGIRFRGDAIWLASQGSFLAHTPDLGQTWTIDYAAPLFKSMAWSSPTHGWVVAGSHTGLDVLCRRTTDAGSTWFWDFNAKGGSQVQFLDQDHGWILVEGRSSRIYRTTNGGGNWSLHYLGASNWIDGICFVTPDSGWAHGGDGTILFSSNGGQTWGRQTSGVSQYCAALFFTSPTEGWAGGGYGGGQGFILHTTNAGQTWTPQTMAAPDHVEDFCFLDNQQGWTLSAVNTRVHRTTDGGRNWEIVNSGVGRSYGEALLMQDAAIGWLIARNAMGGGPPEDGRGFVYRTTDGGCTWAQEWAAPWPNGSLGGFGRQPGTASLWACGNHNTMIRDPVATGAAEPAPPPTVRTGTGSLVVRGVLDWQADRRRNTECRERAELLDVSGRKALDLRPGPNDISRLAPGVYFVREQSAFGSRHAAPTRRVVITR